MEEIIFGWVVSSHVQARGYMRHQCERHGMGLFVAAPPESCVVRTVNCELQQAKTISKVNEYIRWLNHA